MNVGLVQQTNSGKIRENIDKIKQNICECAKMGAELVVLQELHNGLYFCQVEDPDNFDLAETIPGPSTTEFGELAKQLNTVFVLSLMAKSAPGHYYITADVIARDVTIWGEYRKMHIPDDSA